MDTPTTDIATFAAALPAHGALLGLDHGTKTIGIAVSDRTRSIASPLTALGKGRFSSNAADLQKLIDQNDITGLVIGLPLNMDGSTGPSAQSARAFAANLAGRLQLPVLLWDERLSTAAVTRMFVDADTSRRRRAAIIDETAAAYILQGALDRLSRQVPRRR